MFRNAFRATIAAILVVPFFVGPGPAVATTPIVTVRLWDSAVASAYKTSFDALYKKSGIRVKTVVIPWSSYWTQLHTDLATKTAGDIFWVNAGNFKNYARSGYLLPIANKEFSTEIANWDKSVVRQYTDGKTLWGVPQLSDPGIGLFYNLDLLEKSGFDVKQISALKWDPNSEKDSLRTIATQLTKDSAGRNPNDPAFDAQHVSSYGFNAAFDLNAIVINFLGSNGASWQQGDTFNFDSNKGKQAIQYLVNLINHDRVSPSALETNPPAGGNLSRDLFIQGKLALFETGAYNLSNVLKGANFKWGITTIPTGPAGAVSVTNGIVAAASKYSKNKSATLRVLKWLGGEGSRYIGQSGSALPAVKSARASFFTFWQKQNVDISAMITVLNNGYVQAPSGANYAAAEAAYLPYFEQVFAGQTSVASGLAAAQVAANKAMTGKN